MTPDAAAAAPPGLRPPLGAFENYIKGLLAATPAAQATFLETALQDYPGFERARLSLWEVRTDQGDHAAALAAVRPIPSTSSMFARARFFAATSMLNLQHYDDAFETYSGLLAVGTAGAADGPMRGAVNNNLGIIQLRRGGSAQSGTAVYFLTKATEADPGATDSFFNLGYAYVLDRNAQAAIYWLREALRREPADADAHVCWPRRCRPPAAPSRRAASAIWRVSCPRTTKSSRARAAWIARRCRAAWSASSSIPTAPAACVRASSSARPLSGTSGSRPGSTSSAAAACSIAGRTVKRWTSCGGRSTSRPTKPRRTC